MHNVGLWPPSLTFPHMGEITMHASCQKCLLSRTFMPPVIVKKSSGKQRTKKAKKVCFSLPYQYDHLSSVLCRLQAMETSSAPEMKPTKSSLLESRRWWTSQSQRQTRLCSGTGSIASGILTLLASMNRILFSADELGGALQVKWITQITLNQDSYFVQDWQSICLELILCTGSINNNQTLYACFWDFGFGKGTGNGL